MSKTICRWCLLALVAALLVPALAEEQWRLYQFLDNEHFRYKLKRTEDGTVSTGHFALTVRPAGDGKLKMKVAGKLADAECSAETTVDSAQAVPAQMMMSCMMLGEVMVAFHTPAFGFFAGRQLNVGDNWSMAQGDESMSFSVERECTHAGHTGKLAVMKQNDELRLQSCVATDMPLPLASMFRDEDGNSIEMELVEYSR